MPESVSMNGFPGPTEYNLTIDAVLSPSVNGHAFKSWFAHPDRSGPVASFCTHLLFSLICLCLIMVTVWLQVAGVRCCGFQLLQTCGEFSHRRQIVRLAFYNRGAAFYKHRASDVNPAGKFTGHSVTARPKPRKLKSSMCLLDKGPVTVHVFGLRKRFTHTSLPQNAQKWWKNEYDTCGGPQVAAGRCFMMIKCAKISSSHVANVLLRVAFIR